MENPFGSRAVFAAALLGFAVFLLLPRGPVAAQGEERGPTVESNRADVKLPDLELLDQDGRRVRFKSDVVGERLAVIDVFFTSCGLVCPILSAIFADLQDRLGDRLGEEVSLVSVSVDPNTDIPPRLKEYASRYGARPGWVFLTGEKPNVDRVLRAIGAYTADFTEHPTMILVGDGRTGEWTRFYGFASPEQLLERVDALSDKRRATAR
jgi:protein SCO1